MDQVQNAVVPEADSVLRHPIQIGRLSVSGRVFKSATSETRATPDGYVSDELLDFYIPMAEAGTPLIITGNICVSAQGHSAGRQACIDADDKLSGLKEWVQTVHSRGSKLVAQINHGGRQVVRNDPDNPVVSASDVRETTLGTKPRPLQREEMPEVVESFAAAAGRAQEAGFAGVELHFAHGYLVSQFLTPHTNRRTDDYGGSLRNRMRLPLEILRAVRRRVGGDYPIIAKMNCDDGLCFRGGARRSDLVEFARAMESEGLDAVELSRAHYESIPPLLSGTYHGFRRLQVKEGPLREAGAGYKRFALATAAVSDWLSTWTSPKGEGYNLPATKLFKENLSIPVIANGGFHTRGALESAIGEGICDAVSCGRAFIADPYFFQHLFEPDPEAPDCLYCNLCAARLGVHRLECYNPKVIPRRRAMLQRLAR